MPQRGTLHGKPAVMAGFWGSAISASIDLDLEQAARGMARSPASRCEARPIYARVDRQGHSEGGGRTGRSSRPSKADHEATLAYVRQAGRRRPPCRSSPISRWLRIQHRSRSSPQAQSWYRRERCCAATPFKDLPLLSAATPFKAGGRGGPAYFTDIKARPPRHQGPGRHLYLPEHRPGRSGDGGRSCAAGSNARPASINRIDPGLGPGSSRSSIRNFPAFNFDVIAGVTYRIDPTQPSRFDRGRRAWWTPDARRIVDLAYRGDSP